MPSILLAAVLTMVLAGSAAPTDATLEGIPESAVRFACPGLVCVVFETSDFEGMEGAATALLGTEASEGSSSACDFACYKRLVRMAFEEADRRLMQASGGEALTLEGVQKVVNDGGRAELIAAVMRAETRLRSESRIADDAWRLAVRRAALRLGRAHQGHGLAQQYGVDTGLALTDNLSARAAPLRGALVANAASAARFSEILRDFDAQAGVMRSEHLSSEYTSGRLQVRSGAWPSATPQAATIRREHQRAKDWRALNRRMQENVVALATEVGATELALEWVGELECRASPEPLGEELRTLSQVLRGRNLQPTADELVEGASLDAFLSAYLPARNARMSALADAALECVALRAMHKIDGPAMAKAVERLQRAGEEWEHSERTAAAAVKELFTVDARQHKAIDGYTASLLNRSWESWRVMADIYRHMGESVSQ